MNEDIGNEKRNKSQILGEQKLRFSRSKNVSLPADTKEHRKLMFEYYSVIQTLEKHENNH
jgi:hypothetical protein